MAAEERERATKKKLQIFLAQMLKMGCVKGFKYFNTYMRGREEMITTVMNNDVIHHNASPSVIEKTRFTFDKKKSGIHDELPLEQLSGIDYMDISLPPASPSEREIGPINKESTLFLIAGYGKYSCPYVWVRSNHERLVKLSDNPSFSKDSPLRLKSTSAWREKDVKVWQVLAELVKLCTRPAPKNPFEVDMKYFDSLGQGERVIALGAMSYFLQCVVTQGSDRSFSGLVAEDLREVQRWHFREFQRVLQKSVAKSQQQEQQQHYRQQTGEDKPAQRNPYLLQASVAGATSPRKHGPGGRLPKGPGMAVSQQRQERVGAYGKPGQMY